VNKVYEQLVKVYRDAQWDSGKAHLNELRAFKNIERLAERMKICDILVDDKNIDEWCDILNSVYTMATKHYNQPEDMSNNQKWAMKELMLAIVQEILTEEEYIARVDTAN